MSIYRARLRNTSNALSPRVSSEQIRLQVPPKLFGLNLCLSLSCFYSAFSERINLVIMRSVYFLTAVCCPSLPTPCWLAACLTVSVTNGHRRAAIAAQVDDTLTVQTKIDLRKPVPVSACHVFHGGNDL